MLDSSSIKKKFFFLPLRILLQVFKKKQNKGQEYESTCNLFFAKSSCFLRHLALSSLTI